MTDNERIAQIVADFAVAFWRQLCWQAGQFIPGTDAKMEPSAHLTPENIFQHAMEPQEWLVMARYGAGLIDEDADYIYEICQGVAEWLFAVPGSAVYTIPETFYDNEFGALWGAALLRSQGDALITIGEAAELAGVSVQAISQRIDRGTLRAYVNPLANARQGRRLVRRSDVAP